jgi:glutathione S-transferase
MIKVFHTPKTRSLRVLWLAEEMGLDYEAVPVNFFGPKSPEFLAVNPTGTLPAMTDGAVVLTESVAILQYLTDRYGPTPLAVRPDAANYPDYLQFLWLGEAGLSAPMNAVVRTRLRGAPEDQDSFALKVIIDGFFNRLQLVTRQLERHPYMAGPAFTAADISVSYPFGIAIHLLKMADRFPASVVDYYERVTARPAYQRAFAVA